MMDAHDTNLPLNQGELEEEKKTVEVSEAITETPTEEGTEKVTEEVTAEVQTEAAPKPATKEDVLNRLKELAQDSENANKQEMSVYKTKNRPVHVRICLCILFITLLFFSLTEVSYPVQLITHQCSSVKTFLSDLDRLQVHRIFQSTFLLHEHSLLPFGS